MAQHLRYAVELNTGAAREANEAPRRQHEQRFAQELNADLSQIDRFK